MKNAVRLSRRRPCYLTEELTAVLSAEQWIEFKPLFLEVYTNLRARQTANGGEEMLRLRAYERLQDFVQKGMVQKDGKSYRGNKASLSLYAEELAATRAIANDRAALNQANLLKTQAS